MMRRFDQNTLLNKKKCLSYYLTMTCFSLLYTYWWMKNQRVAELSKYSVFLFITQKRPWEQTRAGLRTPESKFFSQTAPDHAGYKHHHDQGGVNSPTHCMLFTFTRHLLVHSNIFSFLMFTDNVNMQIHSGFFKIYFSFKSRIINYICRRARIFLHLSDRTLKINKIK